SKVGHWYLNCSLRPETTAVPKPSSIPVRDLRPQACAGLDVRRTDDPWRSAAMASTQNPNAGAGTTLDFPVLQDGLPGGVALKFGARTHRGKVRENNEDHFLVARLAKSMQVCKSSLPDDGAVRFSDEQGYLMVVADGMGGAAAGEHASALAV